MQARSHSQAYQNAVHVKDAKATGFFASLSESVYEYFESYTEEKQVASIRVALEDATSIIRSSRKIQIPFPASVSLDFSDQHQLLQKNLTTEGLRVAVRARQADFQSNVISDHLYNMLTGFIDWADGTGRGDASGNQGRLHFINYLFERCTSIHDKQGSQKLDELLILEEELRWALSYEPFAPGNTNDTHFRDKVSPGLKSVQRAIEIQEEDVVAQASLQMLTTLEGHARTTLGAIKGYLCALPSGENRPPSNLNFESYATTNPRFIGTAVMGGIHGVFVLDSPRAEVATQIQTPLNALNKYLNLLENKNVVPKPRSAEEKKSSEDDQADIFLKNQDELTVYFPKEDVVRIYQDVKSSQAYRFDVEGWRAQGLSDLQIEMKKIELLPQLIQSGKIVGKAICEIPAGITASAYQSLDEAKTSEFRLAYWDQHKKMLKSARAIQKALNVYMALKEYAKVHGDVGFYVILQHLLEQIINLDREVWLKLSANIRASYDYLEAKEGDKIKLQTHVAREAIDQARATIGIQAQAAETVRDGLIKARQVMLEKLKNDEINVKKDTQHLFSVFGSYLDSLAVLNHLTLAEKTEKQRAIGDVLPPALRHAGLLGSAYTAMVGPLDAKLQPGSLPSQSDGANLVPAPSLSPLPVVTQVASAIPVSVASSSSLPASVPTNPFSASSSTGGILGGLGSSVTSVRVASLAPIPIPIPPEVKQEEKIVLPVFADVAQNHPQRQQIIDQRVEKFNAIRNQLGLKTYDDYKVGGVIDPFASLKDQYHLIPDNLNPKAKLTKNSFEAELKDKSQNVLTLGNNMYPWSRWWPWNWRMPWNWGRGWGRDEAHLKIARLVLCQEMVELFSRAARDINNLSNEEAKKTIEGMYSNVNSHLEAQKKLYTYRSSEVNQKIQQLQSELKRNKDEVLREHQTLKDIESKIIDDPTMKTPGLTTVANAVAHAKKLKNIPASELKNHLTDKIKISVENVFKPRVDTIKKMLPASNPFVEEKQRSSNPFAEAEEAEEKSPKLLNPFAEEEEQSPTSLQSKMQKFIQALEDIGLIQAQLLMAQERLLFTLPLLHEVQEVISRLRMQIDSVCGEMDKEKLGELLGSIKRQIQIVGPASPEETKLLRAIERSFVSYLKEADQTDSFENMQAELKNILDANKSVMLSSVNAAVMNKIIQDLKLDIKIEWQLKPEAPVPPVKKQHKKKIKKLPLPEQQVPEASSQFTQENKREDHNIAILWLAKKYIIEKCGNQLTQYKQIKQSIIENKGSGEQARKLRIIDAHSKVITDQRAVGKIVDMMKIIVATEAYLERPSDTKQEGLYQLISAIIKHYGDRGDYKDQEYVALLAAITKFCEITDGKRAVIGNMLVAIIGQQAWDDSAQRMAEGFVDQATRQIEAEKEKLIQHKMISIREPELEEESSRLPSVHEFRNRGMF